MRVALVAKYIAGSFFINFFRKFAAEVTKNGIDMTILAGVEGNKNVPNPLGTGRELEEVHVQYPSVALRSSTGIVSYPSWMLDDRLFAKAAARMLGENYDVVQCDNPVFTTYIRRGGFEGPLVYNCIDGYLLKPNLMALRDRLLTKFYHSLMEMKAASAADYIACMNGPIRDFFSQRSVDSSKLRVIPPIATVDADLFKPAANRYFDIIEKYGMEKKCTIVFVGRLFYIKGIDILFEATRLLIGQGYGDKIRVLVVGPFSDIQAYGGRSAYAIGLLRVLREEEMKGVVSFTGPLGHDILSRLLASAQILVLPSRQEGLGVVLLEAMSCGLPVVGSRVGGIPSVIREGENGYMFDPSRADELADRLRMLIDSVETRNVLGARGRELVLREYALTVVAEKYSKLYTEAVETEAKG